VIAGVLLSLGTGDLILLGAVLTTDAALPTGAALIVLAISGLLAPALARALAITSIDRLGPTTAIPIQGSVYPLCAVAGALLFLGESLTLLQVAGVVAIVLGVWMLTRNNSHGSSEPAASRGKRARAWTFNLVLLLPAAAGLSKGLADLVRKEGLDLAASATGSAFIGQTGALVAWALALSVPAVRSRVRFGRGWWWFSAGGVLASLAVLSQFHALDRGAVSVVSPIVAAQPVAVILFSALLLRHLDPLTPRRVSGALVAVAGTILVSL
jgi:drug/metabolite transporter (DMT)-like permease